MTRPKTAFTLLDRLKYKLNLHSGLKKHVLVVYVFIGCGETRIFLSDRN
jgi:hypothetical protein